jgi:hypothetical protein
VCVVRVVRVAPSEGEGRICGQKKFGERQLIQVFRLSRRLSFKW